MEVVFSSHARRRMAIYGNSREDVLKTIELGSEPPGRESGRKESVGRGMIGKYGYPLKVVFNQEQHRLTVITVYPLKKEFDKP